MLRRSLLLIIAAAASAVSSFAQTSWPSKPVKIVVPYPPGIPMLMPGESAGALSGPYLSYLRALQQWDARFPGFGHDTHGVEARDGNYYMQCLRRDGQSLRQDVTPHKATRTRSAGAKK